MPSIQPLPQTGLLRFEQFRPQAQRAETVDYNRFRLSQMLHESEFLRLKYGLIEAELELDRLAALGADWDSYGAEPPNATAIQESRALLAELAGDLLLPTAVVPSAEGGVSIYFMNGARTAYVEAGNEGTQALVMYDEAGNTEVLELGADLPKSEVASRILGYLG